jgi:solute carrier family 12 sodium/potassium/chloride transporter 2
VLQAVAQDGLLPQLNYFAVMNDKDEPVRAYSVTFIIAVGCILIGELNLIAPLISMFFMLTYALINYSCFELAQSKSPGWRPSFTYFTWWTGILGFLLCVVAMFLTDLLYACISIIIGLGLYKYIDFLDPHVDWGSAIEAKREMNIIKDILHLDSHGTNVKNFRPSYITLVRNMQAGSQLVKFGSTLRHGYGAMIYGNVCIGDVSDKRTLRKFVKQNKNPKTVGYLQTHVQRENTAALLKEPSKRNLHLLNDAQEQEDELDAIELSVMGGDSATDEVRVDIEDEKTFNKSSRAFLETVLAPNFRAGASMLMQSAGIGNIRPNTAMFGYMENWKDKEAEEVNGYVGAIRDAFNFDKHVMVVRGVDHVDWSKPKSSEGTIDVWWMVDDGGMTILIPFILSKARFWKSDPMHGTNIRLYVIGLPGQEEDNREQITALLKSYRLSWEVIIVALLDDVKPENALVYNNIIATQEIKEQSDKERPRTLKYLRIAEAIQKYSRRAKLVVMTVPFPRDYVNPFIYMSWMEVLTKGFYVPVVLMRGNGKNVLTAKSE